jgi:hypothetical protein
MNLSREEYASKPQKAGQQAQRPPAQLRFCLLRFCTIAATILHLGVRKPIAASAESRSQVSE